MDTFDVLKAYNLFKEGPISAEDEQVHQALSEGQELADEIEAYWASATPVEHW